MFLNFYNPELDRIGTLFSWVSLSWNVRYNTSGNFLIETQLTEQNAELLKPLNYVMLDVDKSGAVMQILSLQKTDENHLIASGYDATYLLAKRATAAGRSSVIAETAIRKYVSDIEPFDVMILGDSAGISTRYQGDISGGTVLEVIQQIAMAADIGLRVKKSGNSLIFDCYKPDENPNARYATKYGNLTSSSYAESIMSFGNVALVKSKDENDNIVTFLVGDTESADIDRHELFVDLTGEVPDENETAQEFRERLERYAWQRIAEAQDIETISFDLYDDRANIGDIVTVYLELPKLVLKARIVGINIVNQGNATKKAAEIGKPIIVRR